MVLRTQNILGLNRAPCLAVFLERLPLLLQEQYSYERVIAKSTFQTFFLSCFLGLSWDVTLNLLLLKSRVMWQPVTSSSTVPSYRAWPPWLLDCLWRNICAVTHTPHTTPVPIPTPARLSGAGSPLMPLLSAVLRLLPAVPPSPTPSLFQSFRWWKTLKLPRHWWVTLCVVVCFKMVMFRELTEAFNFNTHKTFRCLLG